MNERFKSILAILAFSFIALVFYGQNKANQIEIKPFFRRDNYPTFTNAINVISTSNLKFKGIVGVLMPPIKGELAIIFQ